jgi:hypothetical protein
VFKQKVSQVPVAYTCTLATQEAEIRRITVPSQPGQTVPDTLSLINPSQKRWNGSRWAHFKAHHEGEKKERRRRRRRKRGRGRR